MSDPQMIQEIQAAVTIPIMAKARIGHFAEAQILEALDVDYIDESEVLTPADEENHIDKWAFTVPFVCGATNLGEALRRIGEGACLIRSKGEAGTGNVVEAVRHLRTINAQMRRLHSADANELYALGEGPPSPAAVRPRSGPARASCPCRSSAPAASRRRPTPRSSCNSAPKRSSSVRASSRARTPTRMARPSSKRRRTFEDPSVVAKVSTGLGAAMKGGRPSSLEQRLAERGW
jgi:pyridoxal 5'-phosphate synthase pdxS subunit